MMMRNPLAARVLSSASATLERNNAISVIARYAHYQSRHGPHGESRDQWTELASELLCITAGESGVGGTEVPRQFKRTAQSASYKLLKLPEEPGANIGPDGVTEVKRRKLEELRPQLYQLPRVFDCACTPSGREASC
jgi:hypothetical protein